MSPGVLPGVSHTFACRSANSDENGRVTMIGTAAVGGRAATHVRLVGHVGGADSGIETVDWWSDAATGLPLRIVLRSRTARSVLLGTAHYSEDADLRLTSLKPLR